MTPDERRQAELEYLEEYQERLSCLNILRGRVQETGWALRNVGSTITERGTGPLRAQDVERITTFPAILADYRATRNRCMELYAILQRSGLGQAVVDVSIDHPER